MLNLARLMAGAMLFAATTHAQDDTALNQVDPLELFEARVVEYDNVQLSYRLLKPLDYDPGKEYPLVLFLHGAGERGDDNEKQLLHGGRNFAFEAMRRRHPAFVVFPQCPAEMKWVDLPWDAAGHKVPEDPSDAMDAVFALVEALHQFPIDSDRVYGVGLSMGGYGTWDILQRKPEMLAAL